MNHRLNNRLAHPFVWLIVALTSAVAGCAPATEPAAPGETTWDSCYVQGEKVGYVETTIRKTMQGRRELLAIDSHSQIGIRRFGDTNQMDVRTNSIETPVGEVRQFTVTTKMGGEPVTIRGRPAGEVLELETESNGKTEPSRMAWQPETKGFQGVELSLERDPLQPGEARRLSLLVPLVNQVIVAEVELLARQWESTKVLDGSQELLHIDCQLTPAGLKGKGIQTVMWTDKSGQTIKTLVHGLEQEGYRTTREQALEPPKPLKFDLGFDTLVKVAKPLPPPAKSRRIRYRVELDGEDPSLLFPNTPFQQVTKVSPNVAEIVVTAPSYEEDAAPDGDSPTTPDDLTPNNMLQCDDPTIVKMANEARGQAQDPLAIARALEAYVHRTVSSKNFSQAFATALEVARSHEGDCTEHAVLLAALARACEIPARVVVGLVYVPSSQGFGYHMWTEVFAGRWQPLDATLGQGGIGAGYLTLGESNLKDATTLTTLVSVLQVIGRLKIEVLEAE